MPGLKHTKELYRAVLVALTNIPPEVDQVEVAADYYSGIQVTLFVGRICAGTIITELECRQFMCGRVHFVRMRLNALFDELKKHAHVPQPKPGKGAAWGEQGSALGAGVSWKSESVQSPRTSLVAAMERAKEWAYF